MVKFRTFQLMAGCFSYGEYGNDPAGDQVLHSTPVGGRLF